MPKAIYIHIPFCKHICSYCDFCKFFYRSDWVEEYLIALEKELESYHIKDKVRTIYIGGGTPSVLSVQQLKKLFEMIATIPREDDYEYTIECNVETMSMEKLELMKQCGINRISYGVETTHERHLKNLERSHTFDMVKEWIDKTKEIGIQNISVDLIYALPTETLEEVKEDVDRILSLDVPHVSMYSLIIEEHTKFSAKNVQAISEDLDYEMYQYICNTLKQHGYEHYEVSNFARPHFSSRHNLVYWNNEEYYGIGLGASGYIGNVRYTNTRSLNQYFNGVYRKEEEVLSLQETMENEMMLGLRKMEGVSQHRFFEKYQRKMEDVFPIETLLKQRKLEKKEDYISIPKDKIYVSNEILLELFDDTIKDE